MTIIGIAGIAFLLVVQVCLVVVCFATMRCPKLLNSKAPGARFCAACYAERKGWW